MPAAPVATTAFQNKTLVQRYGRERALAKVVRNAAEALAVGVDLSGAATRTVIDWNRRQRDVQGVVLRKMQA